MHNGNGCNGSSHYAILFRVQAEEIMNLIDRLNQNRLFKWFLKLQDIILVVCNLGSACVVVYTVILRYFLKKDFIGADEILVILMIWMYCVGGAYGSYEGTHITADILSSYMKDEKKQRILAIFQQVVSIFVVAFMTYFIWKYLGWSFSKKGLSTTLKYPLIIPQSALGVGFTLMLIFHVIHLIDDIHALFSMKKTEEVTE